MKKRKLLIVTVTVRLLYKRH